MGWIYNRVERDEQNINEAEGAKEERGSSLGRGEDLDKQERLSRSNGGKGKHTAKEL